MSLQDPIADMLTRIRNGQRSAKQEVMIPASKAKLAILKVMKDEGFIESFEADDAQKPQIKVTLKYFQDKPVIELLKRVSRPGLRHFSDKNSIPEVMDGLGVAIVSTSRGVMSGRAARALGEGGEVLCFVA